MRLPLAFPQGIDLHSLLTRALAGRELPAGLALRVPGLLVGDERASAERVLREHQDYHHDMRRRIELAKMCAKLIVARLTRLGLCYRREGNNALLQQVRFVRIDVGHEAAFLWIDTLRLPRNMMLWQLYEDKVLHELSMAVQREVTYEENLETGFAYVIEFKSGYRRIPRTVDYSEMLKALPADAGPLVVPIGVGENYRYQFGDIAKMPHLLVGGATMQGKSNELNAMLCTLIQRNTPDRLKLLLVDLKGGMEFSFYDGVPHLLHPIVTQRDDVVPALKETYTEIERRMAMFKGVTRDIRGWNARRKAKLPYWLVVVDELMNIMLDQEIKGGAERLLADIAARSRAVGVHCILCTQRPQVEVVSGLIKGNYPTRLAFACADDASSRVILDNNDAARLGHVGRLIYYFGSERKEYQAPLVSDAMVREIVDGVKAGKDTLEVRKRHDVTAEDMFRYAIEHLGGRFSRRMLYDEFQGRGVRRNEIEAVGAEYEGQEIEIDGQPYVLQASPGGTIPRMLVACGLRPEESEKTETPAE